MAEDKGKGSVPSSSGLGFFLVIIIVFSLWLANNGPNKVSLDPGKTRQNSTADRTSTSRDSDKKIETESRSPYYGQISLSAGSARSTIQPNQEYIIISARGNKEPINIGGWVLKNGRGKKNYVVSGNTVRGQSVSVVIPDLGLSIYHPFDISQTKRSKISLKSGERAYIITGSLPSIAGIQVKDNFKTNRCLGYLEDKSGYRFYPRLSYNCPSSREMVDTASLDDVCYNFIRSVRSCHIPEDIYIKDQGYCLDRNCKLSSACRALATSQLNFQSCFNTYSRDDDFSAPEWRVFLNRTWELWESNRETISLYDRQGLLVTEISY